MIIYRGRSEAGTVTSHASGLARHLDEHMDDLDIDADRLLVQFFYLQCKRQIQITGTSGQRCVE